jgi:hypothetical protein
MIEIVTIDLGARPERNYICAADSGEVWSDNFIKIWA